MNRMHRHLLGVVVALACVPALAENHAMIVGVTKYPALANLRHGQGMDLKGPANDAGLVTDVLLQRGFKKSLIVELSERPVADGRPTRKNILERLEALASSVDEDDFVYLHFAGHGTRQPAKQGDFTETDGLDEIFLPADAAGWNAAIGSVENALVDNEIGGFLDRIRGRGANVWIVFDSCHSGTMTRGGGFGEVRYRKIDPTELGIPASTTVASRGLEDDSSTVGFVDAGSDGQAASRGYLVEFFAAQSTQTTPEMPLPLQGEERKFYGVFTFQLMSALARHRGISYNQLGQQVLKQYRAMPWRNSQPLIQGVGDAPLNQPVFGEESTGVRVWPAARGSNGETLSIGAGRLQNFTTGSVIRLYKDAVASEDSLLGRAEIIDAGPVSSRASVLDASAELEIPRVFFTVLERSEADFTLSVAPLPVAGMNQDDKAALEESVRAAIEKNPLLTSWGSGAVADLRVSRFENATWFLLSDQSLPCEKQEVSAVEREECQRFRTPQDLLRIGDPSGFQPDVRRAVANGLERIAIAENLIRVQDSAKVGGSESASPLVVDISYSRDGKQQDYPVATVPVFRTGDSIHIRIKNTSGKPQDVGLLYVDALYGITDLTPLYGINNRIMAGESIDLPAADINPEPEGEEHFIVLSRPGIGVNLGFNDLEQPPLGVGTRGPFTVRGQQDTGSMQVFRWQVRK